MMHLKPMSRRPARAEEFTWTEYDNWWAGLLGFIFLSVVVPEKLL